MTRLISLAEFQQIKLISAKVASAKVNKTAKVPAFLCSLDVGHSLLEVQFHLRQNAGHFTYLLAPAIVQTAFYDNVCYGGNSLCCV